MTIERAVKLLSVERECVRRNGAGECDRECGKCDLVQEDAELIEMYDLVLGRLKEERERS